MTDCMECGRPTQKARCDQCRVEHAASTDHEFYECPHCGGTTTGRDVECADCRRVDDIVGQTGGGD